MKPRPRPPGPESRTGTSGPLRWYALMLNCSEFPVHYNWVSGKNPPRTLTRPSLRLLERGDIIMNELEASWIGYRAQGVQPVFVAEVDPVYRELIKVQREVFHRVC